MEKFLRVLEFVMGYIIAISLLATFIYVAPILACIVIVCSFIIILADIAAFAVHEKKNNKEK